MPLPEEGQQTIPLPRSCHLAPGQTADHAIRVPLGLIGCPHRCPGKVKIDRHAPVIDPLINIPLGHQPHPAILLPGAVAAHHLHVAGYHGLHVLPGVLHKAPPVFRPICREDPGAVPLRAAEQPDQPLALLQLGLVCRDAQHLTQLIQGRRQGQGQGLHHSVMPLGRIGAPGDHVIPPGEHRPVKVAVMGNQPHVFLHERLFKPGGGHLPGGDVNHPGLLDPVGIRLQLIADQQDLRPLRIPIGADVNRQIAVGLKI